MASDDIFRIGIFAAGFFSIAATAVLLFVL
jgi:hypothetical protein